MIQERLHLQHPDISRSAEYELGRVRNPDGALAYVLFLSGFRDFAAKMEVLWICAVDNIEATAFALAGVPVLTRAV